MDHCNPLVNEKKFFLAVAQYQNAVTPKSPSLPVTTPLKVKDSCYSCLWDNDPQVGNHCMKETAKSGDCFHRSKTILADKILETIYDPANTVDLKPLQLIAPQYLA